jgi:hypothetical protein
MWRFDFPIHMGTLHNPYDDPKGNFLFIRRDPPGPDLVKRPMGGVWETIDSTVLSASK